MVEEGTVGSLIQQNQYSSDFMMVWKESLPYTSGDVIRWRTNDYDGANRPVRTTHPDLSFGQMVYGMDGNRPYTRTVDELFHQKTSYADVYGNTVQVTENNNGSLYNTLYTYNLRDQLTQVTDANNNFSTTTWDSLGRKIATSDMDMGDWSYTYDLGGLLLTQTDAKSQETIMTYDELGRMKTKKEQTTNKTTTWFYDEPGYGASIGRLTQIFYPGSDGNEAHTYDAMGRETYLQRCITGTCEGMSTTYDLVGRVATHTYPDSEVVTYSYDAAGNLDSVSGYVTDMNWNASRQLLEMDYSNGTTNNFNYDGNREWLNSAEARSPANAVLYTSSYTYNAAALVTSMSQGTPAANTLNFVYDDLNRLTNVTGAQTQTFAYDAIGNMTNNSALGAYTYGNAAHKHAVTQAGLLNNYAYDANGNMTSGAGGNTYTWDAQNRLATRAQTIFTSSFIYGAGEERIQKLTGSTTTRYFSPFIETVNNVPVQYYYAGPILVAKKDSTNAKFWYHADRLGSTRLMTNGLGAEAKEYNYKAYGSIHASAGSAVNNRTFTGQIQDEDTGLMYYGARYYNPTLARFISADTIIPGQYNPQAINRYSYTFNNPINNTDPTGHQPLAGTYTCDVNYTPDPTYAPPLPLIPPPISIIPPELSAALSPDFMNYDFGNSMGSQWQFSVGFGGMLGGLAIPSAFLGVSVNLGITSSGQGFIQFQRFAGLGLGAYVGVGLQGGVSYSPFSTQGGYSTSNFVQAEANAGIGPSVGGSISHDFPGSGSGIQAGFGRVGFGYGVQADAGMGTSYTFATSPIW